MHHYYHINKFTLPGETRCDYLHLYVESDNKITKAICMKVHCMYVLYLRSDSFHDMLGTNAITRAEK
jgi:hypothetical protein